MSAEAAELPLLRFRAGNDDDFFTKPVTIVGRIQNVGYDVVTIFQGPNLVHELYLEDLSPLFGDDEDMAVAVFADASEHNDTVTIALTPERVTYDNPKQLERLDQGAE